MNYYCSRNAVLVEQVQDRGNSLPIINGKSMLIKTFPFVKRSLLQLVSSCKSFEPESSCNKNLFKKSFA